ncbi:MAG: FeoB small GTPase domain-containing protein [Betaproteobacteria bacterium]
MALAGNPNTGKSTVFNAITGLRQHTGNWPGKTVVVAEGIYTHRGVVHRVVDLPGTYSLFAASPEEEVARDFICFGGADAIVAVTDATCLERNLNLVLQIMEITPRVIVCLNLMDEAKRRGTSIDVDELSSELGVPVVPTVARNGHGIAALMDTVFDVASGRVSTRPVRVTYGPQVEAVIAEVEPSLAALVSETALGISPRWVALRLLDGERGLVEVIGKVLGDGRSRDATPPHTGAARSVAAKGGIPA